MDSPAVFDHLRPTDATDDCPPGIYRVVGANDERIALLRVSDAAGRRAHTGEVITVPNHALAFEAAENPDGNRPARALFVSLGGTIYWSFRTFAASLAARPFASALAFALLFAGWFGESVLPLSEAALAGLTLAGALGLAAIGSGRL